MTQLVRINKEVNSLEDRIVGTQYRVGKKLGEGSFGVIYEGKQ